MRGPGAWYDFHVARAGEYFQKYLDVQAEIDLMEAKADKVARNKSVAKQLLEKDDRFALHKSGRTYDRMCKMRDIYMNVAALSTSMARMYATILNK